MSEERRAGYRTRLEALFAQSAPKAVILRRGPRTHFHLISWDLEADVFTHGQWMKGRVQLCDLSPDGSKLLYVAEQYHAGASWRRERDGAGAASGYDPLRGPGRWRSSRRGEARRRVPRYRAALAREIGARWTALSRPPYFTALAVWPSQGSWTGGGFFLADDALVLRESGEALRPQGAAPPPASFRILSSEPSMREAATQDQVGGQIGGQIGDLAEVWPEEVSPQMVEKALRGGGARWVEFLSPRPEGDLLFGCDGTLFRLKDWRSAPPERYLAAATPLLDLRSLRFTRVPPPEEALLW